MRATESARTGEPMFAVTVDDGGAACSEGCTCVVAALARGRSGAQMGELLWPSDAPESRPGRALRRVRSSSELRRRPCRSRGPRAARRTALRRNRRRPDHGLRPTPCGRRRPRGSAHRRLAPRARQRSRPAHRARVRSRSNRGRRRRRFASGTRITEMRASISARCRRRQGHRRRVRPGVSAGPRSRSPGSCPRSDPACGASARRRSRLARRHSPAPPARARATRAGRSLRASGARVD